MTVLFEAKDLRNYSYDELIKSLLTHEIMMKGKSKDTLTEKKKRVDNALRMELSSDNLTISKDDEVVLIIRNFRKCSRKEERPRRKI